MAQTNPKITPFNFVNSTWKKAPIDMDGVYGAQCVDLWKYFFQWLGYSKAQANSIGYTSNGWADGIWLYPNATVLKEFNKITNYKNLKPGDWVIFPRDNQTPNSHISMYWIINGQAYSFGQNQGGVNGRPNMIRLDFSKMLGAFRYKNWYVAPTQTDSVSTLKNQISELNKIITTRDNTIKALQNKIKKAQEDLK